MNVYRQALDLTGDVGKDGYIEPLAVYREAALRVRNGQEVLPCVLSALFRYRLLLRVSLIL